MWSEGTPFDYYSRSEAEEAIYYAKTVIEFVEDRWRSLKRGGKKG